MELQHDKDEELTQKPRRRGVSVFTFCITVTLALSVGLVTGSRSEELTAYFYKDSAQSDLSLLSVQQTYDALKKEYDGTLDRAKLVEGANRGLVDAAGDPYSVYLTKKEAEALKEDLDGTFSGIGAELDKKDGKLVIVAPLDDSPAQKAGVRPADIVAQVNGEDTSSWSIDKAVSKIKGEEGTTVKLTILRGDEVKEISITRAVITDPSVKTEQRGDIGIIRISRFGTDTATLVRKAAQTFKEAEAKGIVLDVRGNGGGYLESAQEISSLWLREGATVVIEKKGAKVTETHRASGEASLQGMPTVVLIDGGSASASEIVAGALKDNQAAKLVGEKTFGKGSVQTILDLSGGAQLKVTVAKWYTPGGKNISKEGIKPDVTVAYGKNDTKENDSQLNKALELLK